MEILKRDANGHKKYFESEEIRELGETTVFLIASLFKTLSKMSSNQSLLKIR